MKSKEARKEPQLSFKEKMQNSIQEGDRQYNLTMEYLRKNVLPIIEEVKRNLSALISVDLEITKKEALNYFELSVQDKKLITVEYLLDERVYLLKSDFLYFERTKNIKYIEDYVLNILSTKKFSEFINKSKAERN